MASAIARLTAEERTKVHTQSVEACGSDAVEAYFRENMLRIKKQVPAGFRVEVLLEVALDCLNRDENLRKCVPSSIMDCMIIGARVGFLPNGPDGLIYIISRSKNVKDGENWSKSWEAVVQFGYKGRITLAYLSGWVLLYDVQVVHENDEFSVVLGTNPVIHHRPAMENPGPLKAVYSVVELKTGRKLVRIMYREQIERIRDNYSDGYEYAIERYEDALKLLENPKADAKAKAKAERDKKRAEKNPWIGSFDEMALKTVVHYTDKLLPKSPAQALAAQTDEGMFSGASVRTFSPARQDALEQDTTVHVDLGLGKGQPETVESTSTGEPEQKQQQGEPQTTTEQQGDGDLERDVEIAEKELADKENGEPPRRGRPPGAKTGEGKGRGKAGKTAEPAADPRPVPPDEPPPPKVSDPAPAASTAAPAAGKAEDLFGGMD